VNSEPATPPESRRGTLLHRLRERGVLRVAASYAVIAWLTLQIASVVFEPLGVPKWVLTALIVAAAAGFPLSIALAWFFEADEQGVRLDTAAEGVPRPTALGLRHYADAIVIGLLLIAVVVLLVRQSDLGKPKPTANPAIAVLPFENLSGDPEQQYFADGFAQDVLDRLGRVPGLTVIARSSSFSFKGKNVDARTIAERLGVTTLLAGSVSRGGNRLKLSAQLIDGASGRQLWSGSFDREMTGVFQVQEEIATAVIAAIVPAARDDTSDRPTVPTTQNLNAYDLYLLGRSAQESRFGGRMRDAVTYLEKALQADPNYAKAHAALSRALVLWTVYAYEPAPSDALQRAESAAYKALALDPQSSEAHAALGTVFRNAGHTARAGAEYQRALEINPNNAVALWDYIVLLTGDPATDKEAAPLLDRLDRLDPRSPIRWQSRVFQAAEGPDGDKAVPAEIDQAVAILADDVDGLRLAGLAARVTGYAPQAYRVSLTIAQAGDAQVALFMAIRTWMLVDDLDRAQRAAEKLQQIGDGDLAPVAGHFLHEIAGLKGDFATWSRLERHAVDSGADDPAHARVKAFWLAAQQRYPEAAQALAQGEPIPDDAIGGLGSNLIGNGQLLPAMLRIYRATGRGEEADAIVQKYLKELRQDPDAGLDLAALAANEGLKDEAVHALQGLFDRFPLVEFFHPQLPWFKSLEGHPGYDRLMAERSRRIEKDHAEMLQLESKATGSVLQLQ
jgi:TolB-like protein